MIFMNEKKRQQQQQHHQNINREYYKFIENVCLQKIDKELIS